MTSSTQGSEIVPMGKGESIIQVIGVGTSIATHIVNYLARYTTELVAAGVTGVILQIEQAKVTIRYKKREMQAKYVIGVRTDLALRFSRAIDYIESNPDIRPSIKAKTMVELERDLDEIFQQLREELSRDSF